MNQTEEIRRRLNPLGLTVTDVIAQRTMIESHRLLLHGGQDESERICRQDHSVAVVILSAVGLGIVTVLVWRAW